MTTSTKVRMLCDEYEVLHAQKSTYATEFQEIVDYILPDRSNVNRFEFPGQRRGMTRYDSTAVEAAEILAGNLAATLTPMGAQWMSIATRQPELRENKQIADWCQDVTRLMLASMSTSNFYLAMDEVYLDLVGFATAAPYAEMLAGKLHYVCWPIRDYVFTIGIDGRARRVYRKWQMPVQQVIERFSDHPGFKELGTTVQGVKDRGDMQDASSRLQDIEVMHEIGPREFYQPAKRGPANMPFESCYINVTDKCILAEGGYEEMPVSIVRWRVTSDDAGWGRGPGLTAMPDVRSLNVCRKMMHRALAKDLDPPLVIDDRAVIGSVRTVPNGITYMRPNSRIEYLTSGQRIDIAQFGLERLTQQVRGIFYADHLRLPPPQGTPMTATEIQIRWELMERLLGPTLGRLQTELLNPIIERTFGLMMRAGQLPQPPEVLLDAELDIEYLGPLARAQQLPEIAAIERTYQSAAGIAQLTGDMSPLRRLNADESIKRIATLHGFPADALRDDDEMAALAEQDAQQAQGMQERQDAMMAAEIASKAGGQRAA